MDTQFEPERSGRGFIAGFFGIGILLLLIPFILFYLYSAFRVEVPSKHIAVMTKKTGKNLPNSDEIAPSSDYKGVQIEVFTEGRHFRNPWNWSWDVVPQVEIPQGKLGVRIRLYGENLSYGEIIARENEQDKSNVQKGILSKVLRPGRYPINALVANEGERRRNNYAEIIELHDPITVPAGFKGVVTNLSGPPAEDPDVLLVEAGSRGVQEKTYNPGTYYVNPYVTRVNLVDCRSQRFNLSEGGEMGFPSKDGFWVTLDGIIEFRIMPDQAAKVFVTYNDIVNDIQGDAEVDEEIINKVILPNARSFCRLRGSDHSGKDFISGDTRTQFQEDFQKELRETCESQGIEIIQALITRINPPQKIAAPVRDRQIALQQKKQYEREILQQKSEQDLAVEKELVKRKQVMVEAEQKVVQVTIAAEQAKEVALVEANQRLKVAEFDLKASKDLASAILARGKAEAKVIEFDNEAEAAGWKKSVTAFGGDGDEFARWVLLKKLAPSYRQIMVNTSDSPMMDIFSEFNNRSKQTAPRPPLSK